MKIFLAQLIIKQSCKINRNMKKYVQGNKDYTIQNFHGAIKKYSFICWYCKIMILKQLEKQVLELYYNVLCHQGETCTESSIFQHFYWKNLPKLVHNVCTKCIACQFLKQKRNNRENFFARKQKPNYVARHVTI